MRGDLWAGETFAGIKRTGGNRRPPSRKRFAGPQVLCQTLNGNMEKRRPEIGHRQIKRIMSSWI